MKTITSVAVLFLMLCGPISWAQSTLTVNVENLKNDKGDILIGLYDKPDNFPRKASAGQVVRVTDKSMSVVFDDIHPGSYAVSVLHDENQNKDLDQNRVGIPKEGYGFSNNVMGVMGPPSFRKATFSVPEGKSAITIHMKYMNRKKKSS